MRTLPIQCGSRAVRNLYLEAPENRGRALLLPGAYYSSQAPGLYFARDTLLRMGWNVLAIDYRYFLAGEPFGEAQRGEAARETAAAYEVLLGVDAGGPLLLAGKSLGSLLALDLALERRRGDETAIALLTPIEARSGKMLDARRPAADAPPEPWSLFALRPGADEARDEAAWAGVRSHFARVEELALPETTHGLDSLAGPRASLAGLTTFCERLEAWLGTLRTTLESD